MTRNDAIAELMALSQVRAEQLDENAADLLADALGLLAGTTGASVQDLVERFDKAAGIGAKIGAIGGTA